MSDDRWPLRTLDRYGRVVLLPEGRWAHVIERHKDLANSPMPLLQAVRFPNFVTADAVHANRRCCYALRPGETKKLKVVVEYSGDGERALGTIITAYLTDRVPANEVHRWP